MATSLFCQLCFFFSHSWSTVSTPTDYSSSIKSIKITSIMYLLAQDDSVTTIRILSLFAHLYTNTDSTLAVGLASKGDCWNKILWYSWGFANSVFLRLALHQIGSWKGFLLCDCVLLNHYYVISHHRRLDRILATYI